MTDSTPKLRRLPRLQRTVTGLIVRVHRDERGTISILSVFTLLMFTALLVLIINVSKEVDDKLRMQNAADAATYSGGVMLARGMNASAFANHLNSDVFSLVAYLRVASDRQVDPLTPEILARWERVAQRFQRAEFPKFRQLGQALGPKIQLESQLVDRFADLNEASAELSLPVLEAVLAEEMLPDFQRTLIRTIPEVARQTTDEVAYRQGLYHTEFDRLGSGGGVGSRPGQTTDGRLPQIGVLWRMNGEVVGYSNEEDPFTRTLPAIDPTPNGPDYPLLANPDFYVSQAKTQREELAVWYLMEWNRDNLQVFDRNAELSQYANLWRLFTAAELIRLLDAEYPESNLPTVIRHHDLDPEEENLARIPPSESRNLHLEANYSFLGVVYRDHLSVMAPGIFRNPLQEESHKQTFAQVRLFVPQPRYWYVTRGGGGGGSVGLGGSFGYRGNHDLPNEEPDTDPDEDPERIWVRENWPRHWDLLNQNWAAKLVPATADGIPIVLQANPSGLVPNFRPPNLGGMTTDELNRVNTH